ncbi:hypothetical protein BpHYR1_039855 [Brachionus plicatilis]|uniref:Uncharacterized protein n=1 Tax=Brachionus plicatilis TaxID=10195 RepID=A0A3M7PV34_BRAPC|nr:hypothetical protein BpHYR1_039855 [Brachionus plicatilis]
MLWGEIRRGRSPPPSLKILEIILQ